MSLSDLKPCPFCGCDGWIVEDRSAPPLLYRPQCKMCGGGLGGFQYRDNAIMVWNTRAEGVAALQQAGEPVALDKNEVASEAFKFLCRKYVQRADDRQKLMGLQITSAETHDLANEIANFVLSLSPLPQQTALVEPK